ncbi:MAG TPA: lactonase family protein [Blastocatellia bacterium]|nr:lactonase family protein [Blastocatellia bacterium]
MSRINHPRRDFLKMAGLGAVNMLCWPRDPTARCGPKSNDLFVYVGTYTNGKSQGIYIYRMNAATGELTSAGVVKGVSNPSYLTIDRAGRYAYCVNELQEFNGKPGGALTSFAINSTTGDLKLLNQQPTLGKDPCHVVLDPANKYALAANYTSGSVAVLPVQQDGALAAATDLVQHSGASVNRDRQEGPHAHCIAFDPEGRFVMVADLGLDKLMLYRLDPQRGKLIANDPPWVATKPGAGPRHIAFHPSGRFVYAINELDSTVTAYSYDRDRGIPAPLQTASTLPQGFSGANTCAEIEVSPTGRFLYGSNRGHNSIVIFGIEPATGTMKYLGHQSTNGKTPRNFAIAPGGRFLFAANQDSDSIVGFRVNSGDGGLTPIGVTIAVPSPVCVKFLG